MLVLERTINADADIGSLFFGQSGELCPQLFKVETGFSPKSFITKARLDYAEYLLKNTNMTITKIAETVGYNAVCGFNKIFLAVYKMSPSSYRKKV